MSVAGVLPEAVRNVHIQLRPKRMLAATLISAVASFTAYVYFSRPKEPNGLLGFLLAAEATILTLGGAIYCLQSIHREKELNTFDYQRITRLTPLELTLGKLLGAPSLMYFITLCLVPITLAAALLSGLSIGTILWIYAILGLGSIAWHAFALLISLLVGRDTSAGAIIFFLLMVFMSTSLEGSPMTMLGLRAISPYSVIQISSATAPPTGPFAALQLPAGQDLLFGTTVPHALVLIVLYVSLTGWFLLGLVRNIKRDPSLYEIYSPVQAFGFVLYLHLIVLAFFQWTRVSVYTISPYTVAGSPVEPMRAESEFLTVSLWFFAVLGLTLLRNRERVRRRILELGQGAASWWAALWPAPYLLGGILAVGFSMIAMIGYKLHPKTGWSFGMAFFEVGFVAAWIIRDVLYLQWMNLRRSRRSLFAGLIYLIVFYTCSSALFVGLGLYRGNSGAYLTPWAIFEMNFDRWNGAWGEWTGALILLACEGLVLAALQRWQLMKLSESSKVGCSP